MIIGFLKYSSAIYFDMESKESSWGGVRGRIRLIEAFLGSGIEVCVLSEIKWNHEAAFNRLQKRFKGLLTYDYSTTPKKMDAVFIDCGLQNFLYKDRRGLPHLMRANRVISKHEGLVIYWHNDPDLNFVFMLESFGPSYFMSPWSSGVSSTDLTRNKTWVMMTRAGLPKTFRKAVSSTRSPYLKLGIPVETMSFYILQMDEPLPVQSKPEWELTYVGNARSRLSFMKSYYNYEGKVSVYGNWPEKFHSLFPYAEFPGRVPQRNVTHTYGNAICSVHVGNPIFSKTAFLTPRFYEILAGGAIPLLDYRFDFRKRAVKSARKLFPKMPVELIVTPENGHERIEWVNSLSYHKRRTLRDSLYDNVRHLKDPELAATQLRDVIKKYRGVDLHQYERHVQLQREFLDELSHSNDLQKRIKASCFYKGWNTVLYYPRVCAQCECELELPKGYLYKTVCIPCWGKYLRLERYPRG